MTPAQSIELTVRAAKLIKATSSLIGVHDEIVAVLIVNQAIEELRRLAAFTTKLKQLGKTSEPNK